MASEESIIMDGKVVAKSIYSEISEVFVSGKSKIKPKLAIILIGNDEGSLIYDKQKIKICMKLGFDYIFDHRSEAEALSTDDVVNLVQMYNEDKSVTGILVQLPLPKHLDKQTIINAIDPKKDVDGIHPFNIGQTFLGKAFEGLTPCTATGVVKMLEYYKIGIVGKNIAVVGAGLVAGKPIAAMLSNRKATVMICNSDTKNLAQITSIADIIVVAVGHPGLIRADMVKEGAVIVDVGITRTEEKIVGDADFDGLVGKVSYISPVPGGVGRLTVACLMANLLKATIMNSNT